MIYLIGVLKPVQVQVKWTQSATYGFKLIVPPAIVVERLFGMPISGLLQDFVFYILTFMSHVDNIQQNNQNPLERHKALLQKMVVL